MAHPLPVGHGEAMATLGTSGGGAGEEMEGSNLWRETCSSEQEGRVQEGQGREAGARQSQQLIA